MSRPTMRGLLPALLPVHVLVGLLHAQQARWQPFAELFHRSYFAMATDPVRQRVVLFGGIGLNQLSRFDDTWEWDGRRWHRIWPPVAPPGRSGHAMAWDPVRRQVLLFGGRTIKRQFGDTWAWDGRTWRKLAPATSPAPRSGHAMVTDPVRRRIVLFGGDTGNPQNLGRASDETWEWDGRTWIQRWPRTVPLRRFNQPMGWDPVGREVIMLGGGAPFPLDEPFQWHWNGTDWRKVKPARGPFDRRTDSGVATVGGNLLLFGGYASNRVPHPQSDVWRWDGKAWHQYNPAFRPKGFSAAAVAADPAGGGVILFGGGLAGRYDPWSRRTTWRWDGKAWTRVTRFALPQGRTTVMAYDAPRDQILLAAPFTDGRSYYKVETWVIRGGRYVQLHPPTAPSYRAWSYNQLLSMTYHAALRKVLLTVGREDWLWDGRTWTKLPARTARWQHQSVYDPHRRKIVSLANFREALEWDAKGWRRRKLGAGLPWRQNYSLAYDVGRRRLVVFGGSNSTSILNDVWEWDGSRWVEGKPKTRPPARMMATLTYVPELGGCVLCGGYDIRRAFGDTWLWDGRDWKRLDAGTLPTQGWRDAGIRHAVYDAGRRRLVATCLWERPLSPATWQLVVPSLTSPQPYPRLGETLRLDVHLPRAAGRPFALAFSESIWPGIPLRVVPPFGVERLPLAPGPLLQESARIGLGGLLDARGRLSFSFAVPNNPWLLWQAFEVAGVAAGAAGIGAITNPQRVHIVR